ncbi:hypothetical protein [Haloplanus natans]|uniref:hypothetical protein n=1 Tax=Haloplanus natans TaxID=376171 RepID=UPI000677FDDB|nr:hypothetical protein [Haloplanus natans]
MATQLSREADGDDDAAAEAPLARRLRDCERVVAERELRTALAQLDGLTPAQRRTVERMAGRIAAGVFAPARDAADEDPRAVARLFDPEHVRDGG